MKEDINNMTFAELFNLYSWVVSRPINGINNSRAKDVVKQRLTEIEEEMYVRAFGFNPYSPRRTTSAEVQSVVDVQTEDK
jgi:ribulose bisphosphate carboxylase small subunit